VAVYVSQDGGLTFTLYSSFTPQGRTDDARQSMVEFNTLSGDDGVVEFRPTVSGAQVAINGLNSALDALQKKNVRVFPPGGRSAKLPGSNSKTADWFLKFWPTAVASRT